ncbi:hypothetical protein [Desulfitobacterium chlororespirans]|uniref:Mpv17 / PMP22 family protein n=1 Tax=Desulfitobacterium chlororespirans DSM 11544 TaxID=1121395 RepID=A0A1M7S495_9FIRM|nr:hypothetical protein [Desulfitobacterium chlororespirans]SHN53224.1 hypothetical protein SAMN02745215_00506 [Desulfitobacterium chlororespirans DSM 11544]
MKRGDYVWGLGLLIWILILAVPDSRAVFMRVTGDHPYAGGFVKFAVLATMGDLLGIRMLRGEWSIPKGLFYRVMVWGIIGLMITLVFTVYMGGTAAAQSLGMLPFQDSLPAQAFLGSVLMNVTFGPMMMVFHRFTDLFIDAKTEQKGKVTLSSLIRKNDWNSLVEFSWLKTCPFFWIPAHTVVFLLPGEYRVLASAFLSIALGALLALAKKQKPADPETAA